jgi:dTDP-4-amino-4,6-dideoxygalactose transaminase
VPGRRHVWHQFVIRYSHRDALRRELFKAGISTSMHYPTPLHLQPVYKSLRYKNGDFPVAERAGRECLSLPIFPELTDDEVDRVCSAIVAATR